MEQVTLLERPASHGTALQSSVDTWDSSDDNSACVAEQLSRNRLPGRFAREPNKRLWPWFDLALAALALTLLFTWLPTGTRDAGEPSSPALPASDVDDDLGQQTLGAEMERKPKIPAHVWNVSADWQTRCAVRRRLSESDGPLEGRNLCWLALKDKCHDNKMLPWRSIQDSAADDGSVPPRSKSSSYFSPLQDPEVCDQAHLGATGLRWSPIQTREAHEWFARHVKVYVLNLPTDTVRWQKIAGRLDNLQLNFTKVEGVDMRIPGTMVLAKKQGWIPPDYDFEGAQKVAYRQGMNSVRGTVGCASAHFKLQEQVMVEGPVFAVAFEDDSWPEVDFVQRLWWLVTQELPNDWEVVSLLSRCGYGKCVSRHLARVQPDLNEPEWRCHAGVNWGMHGVLYRVSALKRVRSIWRPVVFDSSRPSCLDVDVALASISDRVGYYAVPASQSPGFLQVLDTRSHRLDINAETITTATTTTALTPQMHSE